MTAAAGTAAQVDPGLLRHSDKADQFRPMGRPVVRFPGQLRMHHALDELGLVGVVAEISEAARLKHQPVLEPILITTSGTILAGFEHWRLALLEDKREIDCIEYPLDEDEALLFILTRHRPRRSWNAFVRICVALTLEPYLQQKALNNMRAGGKYKGWASCQTLSVLMCDKRLPTLRQLALVMSPM